MPQIQRTVQFLLVSACLACGSFAHAQVLTPATFNTIYAPDGFDSNDNVQIVGEGMFRNTCYRPAPATVAVDRAAKTITVGPVAYEYGGLCLQLVLPFDRTLDVGVLSPGTYSIVQTANPTVLGTINIVATRTKSPDDFLYAPISQAFFRQTNGKSEIALTGDFPSSCMSMDKVEVRVQPKVIVIQPIAKMTDGPNCKAGQYPFTKIVAVDLIPRGRFLIHVRSMNGKAVNTLVNIN